MGNRAVQARILHIDSRGDLVEDKRYAVEYKIGNTRVKICDDYCRNRTQDDIELILKRIAERALKNFQAEALNKMGS